MQKLILPIQKAIITAGYQNAAYRNKFGFPHYGQDIISVLSDRRVYSSGSGKVLRTGLDSTLGLVVIVLYPQSYNHVIGNSADIVIRYYHLASIAVKDGDTVGSTTLLGIYGNSGRYSAGPHLHVEVDYDVKNFVYSATVGKSGTLIRAGTSKTMRRPSDLLHIKKASPEMQSCLKSQSSFQGIPFVIDDEIPPSI